MDNCITLMRISKMKQNDSTVVLSVNKHRSNTRNYPKTLIWANKTDEIIIMLLVLAKCYTHYITKIYYLLYKGNSIHIIIGKYYKLYIKEIY